MSEIIDNNYPIEIFNPKSDIRLFIPIWINQDGDIQISSMHTSQAEADTYTAIEMVNMQLDDEEMKLNKVVVKEVIIKIEEGL